MYLPLLFVNHANYCNHAIKDNHLVPHPPHKHQHQCANISVGPLPWYAWTKHVMYIILCHAATYTLPLLHKAPTPMHTLALVHYPGVHRPDTSCISYSAMLLHSTPPHHTMPHCQHTFKQTCYTMPHMYAPDMLV